MTQHDFTDDDFCSGRWPAPSDREIASIVEAAVELDKAITDYYREHPMKWNKKLPKRTPGEYANDKIWQVKA